MAKNSKTFSFEFFPPKTASGQEKVISLGKEFESVPAEYYSVTFGAGGSTQQGTIDTCRSLFNATKVPIAPHISGIGSDKSSIKSTLQLYKDEGFKKLVVLRGDLPSGFGSIGDFPYAINLIEFINDEIKLGDVFKCRNCDSLNKNTYPTKIIYAPGFIVGGLVFFSGCLGDKDHQIMFAVIILSVFASFIVSRFWIPLNL